MRSASVSIIGASNAPRSSSTSSTVSLKRDMWAPFRSGGSSTKRSSVA